mmetsp:Transcript_15054/g.34531  ORF Transcript_15054/g.34531 Transcript_15054/m.34531 type:complete len:258 (-) Transcript_15054:35-808(-)
MGAGGWLLACARRVLGWSRGRHCGRRPGEGGLLLRRRGAECHVAIGPADDALLRSWRIPQRRQRRPWFVPRVSTARAIEAAHELLCACHRTHAFRIKLLLIGEKRLQLNQQRAHAHRRGPAGVCAPRRRRRLQHVQTDHEPSARCALDICVREWRAARHTRRARGVVLRELEYQVQRRAVLAFTHKQVGMPFKNIRLQRQRDDAGQIRRVGDTLPQVSQQATSSALLLVGGRRGLLHDGAPVYPAKGTGRRVWHRRS